MVRIRLIFSIISAQGPFIFKNLMKPESMEIKILSHSDIGKKLQDLCFFEYNGVGFTC